MILIFVFYVLFINDYIWFWNNNDFKFLLILIVDLSIKLIIVDYLIYRGNNVIVDY